MKEKLVSLDIIRALACIAIFSFHSYLTMLGNWAVSVFIMLSGFVLSYNGAGRLHRLPSGIIGSARYALKKIGRLYPLYFLTLLVLVARYFLLAPDTLTREQIFDLVKTFIICVLLIQSWMPESLYVFALNGVGWYLSTTLFLYFIFPFIMKLISRICSAKKLLWLLLGIYILMILQVHLFDLSSRFVYVFPIYRVLDFSIGCILGYLFSISFGRGISWKSGTVLELTAFILSFAGNFIFTHNYLPNGYSSNVLFVLPAAVLIYSFALSKGLISRFLNCALLRLISDYSAEIFLIHPVVILFVTPVISFLALPSPLSRIVFVASAIIGTALATFIYRRFGRRFPFFAVR